MNLWQDIAERRDQAGAWALVELAKYHEHRRRDFVMARDCTLRALRRVRGRLTGLPQPLAEPALLHRLRRLERRLEYCTEPYLPDRQRRLSRVPFDGSRD